MELNILIVSPDDKKKLFFKSLFRDMGHRVSHAENAFYAIKVFTNYHKFGCPFDLVFTDYLLTAANGISLGKQMLGIDPAVNLVLFPTRLFSTPGIQKDYREFGGLLQEEPDAALPAYTDVLIRTMRKKEMLDTSLFTAAQLN